MGRRRAIGTRGGRRRPSSLPWIGLLLVLGAVAAGVGAFAWRVVAGRERLDEATLCPDSGPKGAIAILLDLTDPLGAAQADRLRSLLERELAEAPTATLVAVGAVSADPADWGARFALCKPEDGAQASRLYQNPGLIAARFEEGFHRPFGALIDSLIAGAPQDRSPIMESLQALLAGAPGALDARPLRIVVVSDLLQHSDVLSFYRGEGWEAFEASGGADRLSRNLAAAEVELWRIPRPEAPEAARAQVGPFWARYLDRQGAAAPVGERILGGL